MTMASESDIHLYTTQTPNGIKISILLEELGEPYLPQLYTLPDRIFATLSDVDGLKDIYTSTN
ncbi:hypothetical protein KC337_g14468, partial [Hortaea werneckii]